MSDLVPASVFAAARAWRDQDPDGATRAELDALIDGAAVDESAALDLASRFSGRLQFGTAGLRGALGAGPMRMNRVLIAQAAAGLGSYLHETLNGRVPIVVVGYDGRVNSHVFARDSAEILAGAGHRAILLPRLLPTPVLAFAVRFFGADAGVMVTASHNPREDNGYKVYLGGDEESAGAQIVPPTDSDIAAHIAGAARGSIVDLSRAESYETADDEVIEAYVRATARVVLASPRGAAEESALDAGTDGGPAATSVSVGHAPEPAANGVPGATGVSGDSEPTSPSAGAAVPRCADAAGMVWAYTAMHGVGWETFARVLDRAGFPRPVLAEAQVAPDGAFPTVAFPNPEEEGAMDLVIRAARDAGAEFAIAHDPDADRLAVAIPDADGSWRRLTGNEIGLLLGMRSARIAASRSVAAPPAWPDAAAGTDGAVLASSLVSSPALAAIARRYGLRSAETLTGFKWIARTPGLVYGYEEALGYLVNPETVRDKDGLSASMAVLALAAEARGDGRALSDLLEEVTSEIGHYASTQVSLRVDDVSIIAGVMSRLRAEPPVAFGERGVTSTTDFLVPPGRGSSARPSSGAIPTGDILRYGLDDGSRVIFRPSGTEPKLKVYLDVRGDTAKDATARLDDLERAVRATLP